MPWRQDKEAWLAQSASIRRSNSTCRLSSTPSATDAVAHADATPKPADAADEIASVEITPSSVGVCKRASAPAAPAHTGRESATQRASQGENGIAVTKPDEPAKQPLATASPRHRPLSAATLTPTAVGAVEASAVEAAAVKAAAVGASAVVASSLPGEPVGTQPVHSPPVEINEQMPQKKGEAVSTRLPPVLSAPTIIACHTPDTAAANARSLSDHCPTLRGRVPGRLADSPFLNADQEAQNRIRRKMVMRPTQEGSPLGVRPRTHPLDRTDP